MPDNEKPQGRQSVGGRSTGFSETDAALMQSRGEIYASDAKLLLGAAVAGLGLGEMDYLNDTITLDDIAAELFALPANIPIRRGDVHARFHPDDAAALAAKIADVLNPARNGFMVADHRVLRPDGSVRWVSVRKQVEFAVLHGSRARRATTGLLAVIDIRERMSATQSQRDSDQRMRLATEATGVGIWEWNLTTGQIRWDAQVFKIYGITPTPDGLIDYSTWSNSVLPEDLPRSEEILQATIRELGRSTREFRILRNDDKLCRVIQAVETVRTNADGQAEWVVGTNLDITGRKQDEQALAASEAHRRTIFEASPDCVKVLSPDGRIEQMNNNGLRALEIDDFSAFRGKRWSALWPEESRYTVDKAVEEARTGRTAHFSGFCPTMKGAPKWWDVIVAPVLGPDGSAVNLVASSRDISDWKRAETILRQNENLFYTLIDEAPMGVYLVDSQFRLQQVNALALPVFETVRPLIGRNFSEVISTLWGSKLGGQIAQIFRHTLETGEAYNSPPFTEQRADIGVEQSFEWQTKRVTMADGKHGVVCYFHEVTERQHAAEALRKSEARFRATFENAAVGIAHVGVDGTWLDVNDRLCTTVGYSRDEILGMTFQDITHPDDLKTDLDHVEDLKSGATDAYSMEKRYIRKDGSVLWANLTVGCVRNNTGHIEYFVSIIEDISGRKNAELALSASAGRIEQALKAGGLGAWELDLVTNTARGDDRIQTMFGTPSSEITQEEFLSLVHDDDRSAVQTALSQAADLENDGHFQFEYRIRRPRDGVERWMNSQGQMIFDNKRPVRAIGVTYDITERKRTEQHIALLMREVNHRSKNLLTVVQAVARQTARKSDPATFVMQLSERIDGLAASQDLLVKNMWQGVDVAALVGAQLSHFKDLLGSRIVVAGPPAELTPAAAQGIGMALHELATNAAKYGALSNSTGRVTINWQIVADNPPEFLMTWTEEGGPPVEAPNHSGFGQMVIGRMVEAAINGRAKIEYRDSGLFWTLTGPVENSLEARRTK